MKNNTKLKIGDRFKYRDELYEICYIENENVRYSNFISGNMYFITKDDLIQKILNGDIKLTNLSIPQFHKNKALTIEEIFKYLNYIFSNKIPCSIKHLKIAIINITKENPDLRKISASTLARYIKIYRDNSDSFHGFYQETGGNKSFRFSIEVEKIINEVILDFIKERENFSPTDAHLIIKERIKLLNSNAKIPSLRTIYRRFQKVDPYLFVKNKRGKREANRIFKASGQSLISPSLLTIVEMDTHKIDCIIVDKNGNSLGRPELCIAIDVYTRAIVGWHLCMLPASATKTLLVLKNMLMRPHLGLAGGLPSVIIPDNGCEFNNNALANFCNSFNITKSESQPYSPNNKPHIESFFKSLNESIIHKLRGTTYSSPLQRGDYDSVENACYTLDTLRHLVNEWIENIYHKRIHSGTNHRPEKMWKESIKLFPVLTIPELEIESKCRTVFRYKINKGQINLKGLRYKSQALATLNYRFKDKVTIYVNQLDLSSIFVQDPFNKNNLIQADSVYPEATKELTLTEWLEAKEILREKYRTDPDEIKNEELLHLARLNFLLKIQNLNKKNKRFKQVKNDLAMMIKNQEDRLNLANLNDEKFDDYSSKDDVEITHHLTYENLPTNLTDFFYEEINFDE
ncbi:DDE-type integrase/transposase/recombinase [Acinetobacter sp. ANC 3791]|uniref:DDE-type integrase/transposase/recombinase n=1 Tax=Acinetobacter sp. ANC 3791 TaxID=2529836 RepID=UPI00103FF174|nr:DDE-type integrase/transposase/recombinase [Acinetobacter sp. ANC 3791]TCB84211.1 transposase [Acinetobacter sp. ANC 3791]